jgi:hypothetical protein
VAYLHSIVFGQKYLHYQCKVGKGIVMRREPTALCSKLGPQVGSSSDNVESTIDCVPDESQPVFQKM